MPDFHPLPPRPAVPVLAPRPDDLYVVLGRAAGRRRRDATVSGLVLAVTVLLATMLGAGPPDRLNVGPVRPVPSGSAPTPVPGRTAAAPVPAAPHDGGRAAPGIRPAGPRRSESPAAASTPTPARRRPTGLFKRDMVPMNAPVCPAGWPYDSAAGWCYSFEDAQTTHRRRSGEVATYGYLMCRDTGRGAGTVRFPTGQELEAQVVRTAGDGTEMKWNYGYGRAFAARETTVSVPEGRCLRWRVVWDTLQNSGAPFQPGDYVMTAWSLGDVGASFGTANTPLLRFVADTTVRIYE